MNTLQLCSITVCLLAAQLVLATDEPKTPPPSGDKPAPARGVKNVGVAEFAKLVEAKANVVLDVRTAREYAAGHIKGAINLDFNSPDFAGKVAALDKSKTYLIHCAAGGRSAKACNKMETLNFASLVNLEPGFKGWEKAGQPVEK